MSMQPVVALILTVVFFTTVLTLTRTLVSVMDGAACTVLLIKMIRSLVKQLYGVMVEKTFTNTTVLFIFPKMVFIASLHNTSPVNF